VGILIDGSTPAIAVQTDGTIATVTTASFTPPPGVTLLIRYSANTIDPNDPGTPTITDNLGTHLSYTQGDVGKRPDSPTADGQVAWWTAVTPSPSSAMTITVTCGTASPNRHAAVAVTVLTGTDVTNPVGQHGKQGATVSTASIAQSYTASRTGSRGFLVTCDWADVGAETAGTATSLEGSADVAANFVYGFFRGASNNGVAGASTTLNVTLPAGSTSLRWAWVEIQPAPDGGGGGWRISPQMLMQILALRWRQVADIAVASAAAETGTTALAIAATGTAVKVAPQTAVAVLTVRGAGVGVKRAPQTSVAAVAARSSGAAAHGQAGSARVVVAAAGVHVKRAVESSSAAAAIAAAGIGVKRAPEVGAAAVAIRQAGAEIHQQAQTGAAELAIRAAGAVTKIAKEVSAASVAVAGAGTAAKRTAQVGTSGVAIAAAGFEQSGTSRAQTGSAVLAVRTSGTAAKRAVVVGAAMAAVVGQSIAAKRSAESGATAAGMRAAGLSVKKAAAAGRGAVTITSLGVGAKRVSASGRTVVPILGLGNATLELPPVRLGDRLEEILNSLVSFTLRLGIFQRVQQHEPKSAPRNNLTAALWLQTMVPAIGESSLDATSLRVVWYLRIYQNFLSMPEDMIDPSVMRAMAAVMEALSADFDLDLPAVRAIDLLGMTGPPMGAEAGYVPMGPPNAQKIYRCMTLTIPIIVDDAFVQAA
jgi:hypothetical protein